MLRIKPFPAIRPLPNLAARVASVPYDVVSTEEARQLAEGNPHSFLHVLRAEIGLPEGTRFDDDRVYGKAAENFRAMLAGGVLVREPEPTMYLYRLVMGGHTQVGLVCCCHIDDYASNVIRRHERTRQDKEDDRTRHMLALGAQPGPVLTCFRDHDEFTRLVHRDTNERPLFHFNAADGVTHTVWRVSDPSPYFAIFSAMDGAYVADGHHRAASAVRAGAQRRTGNPDHDGNEEYNWFLTVLFPAGELKILAYNRVVTDLGPLSGRDFVEKLKDLGTVSETDDPTPGRPGSFCIFLEGTWRRLDLDPGLIDREDPVGSLDAALLQDRLFEPVLGIADPRSDARLEFVGGSRGTDELERRVTRGAAAAFSLHPTSIEQLMAVADAGLVMPPKSTWFEPKLRSGLFVHEI